jgi:ATP-dependent helicase/nuclease subunit A
MRTWRASTNGQVREATMSRNNASAARKPVPKETQRNQLLAADPTVSAWVSANAGTGKTHVLSRRVLRLLLAGRDPLGRLTGTPPERILCLTFTKAAAAEMSQRVFKDLGDWAILDAAGLEARLTDLLGRAPETDERQLARRLFARAIETPGGLKVQTIHSFSEKLLQRFPLEAGIAPNFEVLDEATARALLRGAIDGTLRAATADPASPLGTALELTVTHAVEDTFEQVLRNVLDLAARHDLDLAVQSNGALAAIEQDLRAAFEVRATITADAIYEEMGASFDANVLPALVDALRGGSTNDLKQAERLALAANAGSAPRRAEYLQDFFLTGKGEPRASLMTAKVSKPRPDLQAMMQRAQAEFVALFAEAQGLTVVEASLAIVRVAADVLGRYEDEKAYRAVLDYADLIAKSARLLSRSGQAQWVLYKLDGGLDHILVDEAQDTSRQQWDIIQHLAEEFYSGDGTRSGTGDAPRTVFAVGDEKQSIYRFQGAAPKLFDEMGARFAQHAKAADRTMHRLPLNLSFRTVAPVLRAVDDVFGGAQRPAGVTRDPATQIKHLVYREGEPGLVELWDTEVFEATESTDPWSTEEEGATIAPAVRLASRIADTIRGWLDAKEILPSAGRPIVESDILVLVRKRTPFAAPMIRALKSAGIAVAGADRIRIAEELAVMDLLALADVLLLPEDDLALATVLKSPVCGLTEDDLFALAAPRPGTLWQALLKAGREGRHAHVADELKRWRSLCDYSPPFEFFAGLLDHSEPNGSGPDRQSRGSVRSRLLHRLGPEAADALDELLNLALRYDEQEAPSLQGFLAWMRSGGAEIKRDMDQGRPEVRVMTVHGAKGLEAPIVFLADTCSARSGGLGSRLLALDADSPGRQPLIVWPIKGTSGLAPVQDSKTSEDEADRHEYHRLLYVAMTRARDRLYVCGFEGKRGREAGCWYDLIERGLEGVGLEVTHDEQGQRMRRMALAETAPTAPVQSETGVGAGNVPLPAWATTRAPSVSARAIPLRPSRLAPLSMEADEDGDDNPEPVSPAMPPQPILRPAVLAAGNRFLRGEVTHALLEHLPGVAPARRLSVAEQFLARRAAELPANVRRHIATETLAVLNAPEFGALFGPKARAEVAIAAEIAPPLGVGPPVRITGQIDRLVDLGPEILIVDYKTNRPPPHEPEHVADAYLLQLAAYRLALRGLWPGKHIRCALLWTDGPRIMEIPQPLLDKAENDLWTRGTAATRPPDMAARPKVPGR